MSSSSPRPVPISLLGRGGHPFCYVEEREPQSVEVGAARSPGQDSPAPTIPPWGTSSQEVKEKWGGEPPEQEGETCAQAAALGCIISLPLYGCFLSLSSQKAMPVCIQGPARNPKHRLEPRWNNFGLPGPRVGVAQGRLPCSCPRDKIF